MYNIRIIDGYGKVNVANVTNDTLHINPTLTDDNAGFGCITTVADMGTETGIKLNRAAEASEDFRLRIGVDTVFFNEQFSSTTINTSVWGTVSSTMTAAAQAQGLCVINSASSVATGNYCQLKSWRTFPVLGTFGIYYEANIQIMNPPVPNQKIEWGAMLAATNAVPTDGAFFRLNEIGNFFAVLNYNGIEVTSEPLDFSGLVGEVLTHNYRIAIYDDAAKFWIDDVKVARLIRQKDAPSIVLCSSLPFAARVCNTAALMGVNQLRFGHVIVGMRDHALSKPWSHMSSGMGMMSYQGASGQTVGTTSQLAIAANPTAAGPTATTAACVATATLGLGGIFLANITSLAATTDYIIQSHQVAAGSNVLPGRNLFITGVQFQAVNMGAANAATLMSWEVGLNFGGTNVNQSTGESVTAKLARRFPLGAQSLAASAAIGIPASPSISLDLRYSPIIIQQGEFVQLFIRFINYTSTASQALWCYAHFSGYWE